MFHLSTALHELGYVEGRNLVIERRWAEGKVDRLPGLARELVQLKVDAIVAVSHAAIRSARDATTTIPIVMFTGLSPDPVAAGFVASLARPGGNITGVLIAAEETLAGKRCRGPRGSDSSVPRTQVPGSRYKRPRRPHPLWG